MDHQVGWQEALAFHTWRFLSLSQNTRGAQRGSFWLHGFFFSVSPAEKQPSSHIHGSKQWTKHGMQEGRGMSGLQCAGVFRLHNPCTPHHSPQNSISWVPPCPSREMKAALGDKLLPKGSCSSNGSSTACTKHLWFRLHAQAALLESWNNLRLKGNSAGHLGQCPAPSRANYTR